VFLGIKYASMQMIKQGTGGSIICTSSVAGVFLPSSEEKAKQSKAKQSKAKQSKAKQYKTNHKRPKVWGWRS